jgi:Antibiotic biosynthesis monooxygenase
MPKFATVSTIEVAPGRRDQLIPLLMAHKARCLKSEPETLQFEVMLPRDDDAKVLLYEVYQRRGGIRRTSEWTVVRAVAKRDCGDGREAVRDEVRGAGLAEAPVRIG